MWTIGDTAYWKAYYGEIKSGKITEIDGNWYNVGERWLHKDRAFKTRKEALAWEPKKGTKRQVEKI